jgi:hypothetical protein
MNRIYHIYVRCKIVCIDTVRHGDHAIHTVYFGLVTIEAHGRYRYAAAILCAIAVCKGLITAYRKAKGKDNTSGEHDA